MYHPPLQTYQLPHIESNIIEWNLCALLQFYWLFLCVCDQIKNLIVLKMHVECARNKVMVSYADEAVKVSLARHAWMSYC